jgi:hypothetical protein
MLANGKPRNFTGKIDKVNLRASTTKPGGMSIPTVAATPLASFTIACGFTFYRFIFASAVAEACHHRRDQLK